MVRPAISDAVFATSHPVSGGSLAGARFAVTRNPLYATGAKVERA
jgi:hypothetical protein